jgi:hypothetical protein
MANVKTLTASGAAAIGIALLAPVSASADCKGDSCDCWRAALNRQQHFRHRLAETSDV